MGLVMEEAVSAADANRKFSLLLRGIREGRSYVVTSHGKPIARIVPVGRHERAGDERAGARTTLLARLEKQPVVAGGVWIRDELYEG
jgi:prevent-host-death family protein